MDKMKFPSTWKEFAEKFGFTDSERVYTNGVKIIPVFRVEQWLEHILRGESMREEYDFLQDQINNLQDENEKLWAKLRLLRDKLEVFRLGFPHPCTFDGERSTDKYRLREWLAKLKEEVAEVESEVDKLGDLSTMDLIEMNNAEKENEFEHLTEELLDVITVSTSVLDWLGWSIYGRCQKQKEVNEKNRKRGYWK